jgi:hypothetical protein
MIERTQPSLFSRIADYLRRVRRGSCHSVILHDESGLMLTDSYEDGSVSKAEVHWSEVVRLVAYKRDCFAIDLICFGFVTDERFVEVNEEMEGWEALTDALPAYLPGTLDKADWWAKVALPPFATNRTTLFTTR